MAGSIFCDLEKAFDSVNYNILPSKLPYYGVSGKAKLLLKSYLQNRYQRVQITNTYFNSNTVSKWTRIKYGVPQGLILGPLLFLVYTDDLPEAVENKALSILFADETSILLTSLNKIFICRMILTQFLNN
jgi:sarcosine oxidase/L-pipecolate oxidase